MTTTNDNNESARPAAAPAPAIAASRRKPALLAVAALASKVQFISEKCHHKWCDAKRHDTAN